jgi:hypothetical protein
LTSGNSPNLVGVALTVLAREVLLRISVSLLNVTSNIEGVTGSLGDSETVVESNAGGDYADTCGVSVVI